MFWECFWNPIYAFAPHIFCIQNWRCNLYYLNLAYLIARSAPFIIQLLPICCQYIYANFASKAGGAICILMADLFDCQKCTILRPNYCLFIAGICMLILCLWLEVHYVLSWSAHLYHTR